MDSPSQYDIFGLLAASRWDIQTVEMLGPEWIYAILVFLALGSLILVYLFSLSGEALVGLSRQLDAIHQKKVGSSTLDRNIKSLMKQPAYLYTTMRIGKVVFALISALAVTALVTTLAGSIGIPVWLIYLAELLVLSVLLLVAGELLPKIQAANEPFGIIQKLSGFIRVMHWLYKPAALLTVKWREATQNKMADKEQSKASVFKENGGDEEDQEYQQDTGEREIIENVIEFSSISVREIMTSRVNIVAVSTEDSVEEVMKRIRKQGLSRMPLYQDNLDNILGMIYAKDMLPYMKGHMPVQSVNWKTIARKALFIPSSKRLDDLLRDFQQEKTHIAIVVDEYGGTEGVVTLDDILEEIVGDLADEYDEKPSLYQQTSKNNYIFDAHIDLDDMENILGAELTSSEDEYETLGGLIYHKFERIPDPGESLDISNLRLTVHSVIRNRIRKIKVEVLSSTRNTVNGNHYKQ